jgi:hypothetical protein
MKGVYQKLLILIIKHQQDIFSDLEIKHLHFSNSFYYQKK